MINGCYVKTVHCVCLQTRLKISKPEEFRNRQHLPSKTGICRFLNIIQRLMLRYSILFLFSNAHFIKRGQITLALVSVPQKSDQFGRKRCQKKLKDVNYKLLYEFFQKSAVLHGHSAIENSLSTYVCYDPDGLFWLNL